MPKVDVQLKQLHRLRERRASRARTEAEEVKAQERAREAELQTAQSHLNEQQDLRASFAGGQCAPNAGRASASEMLGNRGHLGRLDEEVAARRTRVDGAQVDVEEARLSTIEALQRMRKAIAATQKVNKCRERLLAVTKRLRAADEEAMTEEDAESLGQQRARAPVAR